ncbi:hypothetical protein I3842_06G111900 [Carya illinoinensis]|uniref:Uncharacterized protein n=1 Tax=Carya illinoinensis TaxID=32201 RepID=A0A922JLP9_CARIL|nr:hypothetical protein I3842_06G111900 [Carya illinoinensis]
MVGSIGGVAVPAHIGVHALTLLLCLPYAVFFDAAASLIFGFFPAVPCVFSVKLAFWSSSSAMEWAQRNKYFHILSRVIGCLPMILQSTSIGNLAGAIVASACVSQKSQVWLYLFPLLGFISRFLCFFENQKYSIDISVAEVSPQEHVHDCQRC